MVNSAGVIQESIWRDREFRALPRTAQAMYVQLLSQKELDRSGIQPLQVSKWAKGCDEMTETDVWRDLETLEDRRFIFVDTDTHELFVRSYMRQSNVIKQPNLMKNALRCAGMVASELLRREMATELRRLRRSDAAQVASDIDPGEPIANPSETLPEPIANPSRTPNPSGTHREPWGEGEGVGEGSSSLLVELREGACAKSNRDEPSEPPSPNCSKHPNGTAVACRPCGQAREARQKWDADRVRREGIARSAEARSRAEARAQAIRACDMCDDAGYLNGTICDHDPNTTERAKRGLAAARAALNRKAI